MTDQNTPTPGATAPDPFARVLRLEPGDRVEIIRIYPNPPVPGVVLGPSRPRYAWGTVTGTFGYGEDRTWDVRVVENGRYVVEVVPDEYLMRTTMPDNPTTGAPAPIPDPETVDDLRERVLHSLDYAIGAISRRDAMIGQLRARVAELEAEVETLRAPDMFWLLGEEDEPAVADAYDIADSCWPAGRRDVRAMVVGMTVAHTLPDVWQVWTSAPPDGPTTLHSEHPTEEEADAEAARLNAAREAKENRND